MASGDQRAANGAGVRTANVPGICERKDRRPSPPAGYLRSSLGSPVDSLWGRVESVAMTSRLFFDGDELDSGAVWREVVPLARLVAVVGAVALVPVTLQWLFVETLGLVPVLTALLSVATQFVLAVGAGVVLLYVVTRALRLADDSV